MEKVLPHDIESEQAVLGSLLSSKSNLAKVKAIITDPKMFYHPALAIVYGSIQSISSQNKPVDIITVCADLKSKNKLDEIGGREFIIDLAVPISYTSNIDNYIENIKTKFLAREFINKQSEAINLAYKNEDLDKVLALSRSSIVEVMSSNIKKDFKHCSVAIDELFEEIEHNRNNPDNIVMGTLTGIRDLDDNTFGLQRGDLWILAGASGGSKTALALNIADYIVKNNHPVLFISLEMAANKLMYRLLSVDTEIEKGRIRLVKSLKDDEWSRIEQFRDNYKKNPLYIADSRGMTIDDIIGICHKFKASHNKIGTIIIDHIGLIRPSKKAKYVGQKFSELGDMAQLLRDTVYELETSVILLSQFNRQIENREDKAPIRSDIYGSDEIYHHSDVVLGLTGEYVMDSDGRTQETPGKKLIYAMKNREGHQAIIPLRWTAKLTKLQNWIEKDIKTAKSERDKRLDSM